VRIFFILLVFCGAVLVQSTANAGKQDELTDLRSRIQALQDELEQTHEDQSEVADALKHSERSISDANRGLRNLAARQRKLSQMLKQLAGDTEATEAEIATQQKHIAELVRKNYVQGGNDALKLMLNGQSPGDVARNVEYYSYIGRARADLIRQHRASLAQLHTLQEKTREQDNALLLVKQERVEQKKTLEAEKTSRQQVLNQLSAQIRQQHKEIDTLVRDEQRLSRLIERLARLAVEHAKAIKAAKAAKAAKTVSPKVPNSKEVSPKEPTASPDKPGQVVVEVADASLAGINFSRLKGRLALPVKGEIINKFGQNREGGGPAWKGLFIRARQGLEVHSVGSGNVAFADWLRGFGNLLIIDHGNGYLSLYSNNESLYKQPGDSVRAGDVVATVGSTGGQDEPGLYFELRHQGNPFDPMSWVN
jgi:septal ring factor EnvC (AmiA/AmiB activator)